MLSLVLLPIEAVLALTYAFIKRDGKFSLRFVIKLLASALFIIIATSRGFGSSNFFIYIFIGLCFSFVGDLFLLFKGNSFFILGMASFLITHIFYIVAFLSQAPFKLLDLVVLAAYLLIGIFFLTRKGLKLGKLKLPVFLYMAVLCFMAAKACSLLYKTD